MSSKLSWKTQDECNTALLDSTGKRFGVVAHHDSHFHWYLFDDAGVEIREGECSTFANAKVSCQRAASKLAT